MSTKLKTGIVAAAFLALTATATASSHLLFEDDTATYAGSNDLEVVIHCDEDNGDCLPTVANGPDGEVEICTARAYVDGSGTSPKTGYEYMYELKNDVGIPEDLPCGQGVHSPIELYKTTGEKLGEGGKITVEADNMDPHVGEFLFAEIDASEDKVRDFMLTDDESTWINTAWNELSTPEVGSVLVTETDWGGFDTHDDFGWYRPASGAVLQPSDESLSELGYIDKEIDNDGGVNNDGKGAEDVWKYQLNPVDQSKMSIGDTNDACTSDVNTYNSCSPAHRTGDYLLPGSAIKGYRPIHNKGGSMTGGGGPFWFICREGALMDSIAGPDVTPQVVNVNDPNGDSSPELYKCDTEGDGKGWRDSTINDWDRVYECNDGLDNEDPSEDQGVDHLDALSQDQPEYSDVGNDPDCDSTSENTEEETKPCPPTITYMADGSLIGNWSRSYDTSTSSCGPGTSEKYSKWKSGRDFSPKRFECEEEKSYSHPKKDDTCGTADYSSSHIPPSISDPSIEAVQYYPSLEDLKEGHSPGDVWNEKYADGGRIVTDTYNGWVSGVQTLHMAEKLYDGGSSDTTCEECDKNKTWAEKGMVDTFSDGYTYLESGGSGKDYIDSWTYGNYSGEENNKIGSPDQFKGGFAGKCPSGEKWVLQEGEWQCEGKPPWDQAVMLPTTAHYEDKDMIGVLVMPYNWKDSSPNAPSNLETYKEAWSDFHDKPYTSDQTLDKLEGTCYPSSSFKLSFSDAKDMTPNDPNAAKGTDYFQKTIDFQQSRDQPLALAEEVQLKDNTSYRCRWKYIRKDGKEVFNTGTVVNLRLNKHQDYSDYFKGEYSGLKEDYTQDSEGQGLEDYVASLP